MKPRDAKPAGVQVNRARRRDASGFEPRALSTNGYLGLLGETGAGMNDLEWIGHANEHLPANLAALTARFVEGSRDEQWLRVSYEPGPTAFNFTALSGGSMAEVLDQAATHCGSFVTGHPCPTLTMTVTILRPGRAKRYLATGRAMKVTGVTALLAADLTDDQGHHIASATLVSHLIKDLSRLC